jgi:hypothetical protein
MSPSACGGTYAPQTPSPATPSPCCPSSAIAIGVKDSSPSRRQCSVALKPPPPDSSSSRAEMFTGSVGFGTTGKCRASSTSGATSASATEFAAPGVPAPVLEAQF